VVEVFRSSLVVFDQRIHISPFLHVEGFAFVVEVGIPRIQHCALYFQDLELVREFVLLFAGLVGFSLRRLLLELASPDQSRLLVDFSFKRG